MPAYTYSLRDTLKDTNYYTRYRHNSNVICEGRIIQELHTQLEHLYTHKHAPDFVSGHVSKWNLTHSVTQTFKNKHDIELLTMCCGKQQDKHSGQNPHSFSFQVLP